MRKILLLLFLAVTSTGVNAQQKAMFTQYMFNGLAVNPAYSAMDEATNVTMLARQQWTGFKGAPNTQTLSAHSPIGTSNSSAGLLVVRDQIGEVISETGVSLTFAQKVQLNEKTWFSAGVIGGFSRYVADYSQVSASAANDPTFVDQNDTRGNFGLGVMVFSDKFYAGISSPYFFYRDLGSASKAVTAYKPHYLIQGGYLMQLSSDVKFKPNVLIKYVNGSPMQIDVNANVLLKETVWLGVSVRSFDSVDALAEVQVTPGIQLGYSYDFTTTQLSQVEKGSHEIMLSFRLGVKGRSFPKCYF